MPSRRRPRISFVAAARRTGRAFLALASAASWLLAPVATPAHADSSVPVTHVVQPGETLSDIADGVGTDSATLAALNAIDDVNVVVVGQSIKLPGNSASAPAPASATAAASAPAPAAAASARTYTVAAGDTLWSVAQQLGTTTAALIDANHLDDPDHLAAGAQLALPSGVTAPPASQPSSTTASAAPGTSASASSATTASGSPATAASGSPATAASAPAAQPASPAPPAPATAASPPRRSLLVSYTVQAGETLSQIAHQFDVPADAIVQASGLDDPNRLSVGTVLKVPVPGREHVVQSGETLRDIAAQEKVDLGSLIDFNILDDPELIHVGQVVLVPAPANGQTVASSNPPPAKPSPSPPSPPSPAPAEAAAQVSSAPAATPAPAAKSAAPAPPQPAAAQPAATKASTNQPAGDQLAGAQVSANQPAGDQPAGAQALASQPVAAQPAATQASANQPAGAQPAAARPGGAQPGGAQPGAKPATPVAVAAPAGSPTDGLAGLGLKLLGAPYVWGGSSPTGFDCSGFVWYVARQAGKQLSRGMLGEYNAGAHPARDELKPGDLVFFQNTYSAGLSHNGIYVGNGQFVHAADETAGVTVSGLGTAYWSSHWFGATRLS